METKEVNQKLQTFKFNGAVVSGFRDDLDEVWVILTDICAVLGVQNPSEVAARLDPDEKQLTSVKSIAGPVSRQQARKQWLVNESGLYEIVMTSNKPIAKTFKRWLRKEVIPSIRKTGGYHVIDSPRMKQGLLFELGEPPAQRQWVRDWALRNGIPPETALKWAKQIEATCPDMGDERQKRLGSPAILVELSGSR